MVMVERCGRELKKAEALHEIRVGKKTQSSYKAARYSEGVTPAYSLNMAEK